jgi:hypothetical protein
MMKVGSLRSALNHHVNRRLDGYGLFTHRSGIGKRRDQIEKKIAGKKPRNVLFLGEGVEIQSVDLLRSEKDVGIARIVSRAYLEAVFNQSEREHGGIHYFYQSSKLSSAWSV